MNFERIAPPDGVHDLIEFNEYKGAKWWTEKRLRRHLFKKMKRAAVVALFLVAYAAMATAFYYI